MQVMIGTKTMAAQIDDGTAKIEGNREVLNQLASPIHDGHADVCGEPYAIAAVPGNRNDVLGIETEHVFVSHNGSVPRANQHELAQCSRSQPT